MSVHFGFPPSSLFILDQAQIKPTIPTRQLEKFGISSAFYSVTLYPEFPLIAILLYTTVVLFLNGINRRRHGKPWAINHTRWFGHAVIVHDVFLALYSAWMFFRVIRKFKTAWPKRHDTFYTVLVANLFCRGGQILPHQETFQEFVFASLLQIYHHAGVILVAWASIRFEYPPALMLFSLNAGVHALMYTYFALVSIHVAVPRSAKAAMTSIQIVQFFIVLIVCPRYLFVYYDVPVDYIRCTEYRKMGDSLDAPASRDAGLNGQSYCNIRTVSCMNKSSHTSVAWLEIFFILSLTWMFLQLFRSTYLQAGKKKTL
ncbi:GNS1/SUR4 family-domain-containing protein [Aspergillus parasiticus]|uniref:Elongation of fatty acids protein n=1 Tax=Aspergillus parasiticus TaxID=5067 RepID=A0A5N6DSL0_ASPPA|nr:GNS1/SUR4 family-domain-containing protein [Aspergillus parasiticus]